MLANVLDMEYESMLAAMEEQHAAMVFFDFEAAFPSLSQEFLFKILGHYGVPHCILQALYCFYSNNSHILKIKGQAFPSVKALSGIRQGCPLSPLLFVLVADLLLRRIVWEHPTCTLRAFADDNGLVLRNFYE